MEIKNSYSIHSVAVALFKPIKFSYIIGSKAAMFTASQALAPVIGFFGGVATCTLGFALRTVLSIFIGESANLFYHVPTLAGSLFLASSSRVAKFMIPAVCMLAFIAHPVGAQAVLYSFYWLIPMGIALFNFRSIFAQALGSTFTTHAVGSVIWLYTKAIPVPVWNGLIAVVWAERLVFASVMTIAYYVIKYAINYAQDLKLKTSVVKG